MIVHKNYLREKGVEKGSGQRDAMDERQEGYDLAQFSNKHQKPIRFEKLPLAVDL